MAIKINVPKTITSVRSTMNTNSFNWGIVTDTDSAFNDRTRYEGPIIITEGLNERYGYVKVTKDGIFSDFEKDSNFIVIVKAIKDLLIEEKIISEEKFNEIYKRIEREREEEINKIRVADKLAEMDKNYFCRY